MAFDTSGFNFRLGRKRVNVERKREQVAKLQDELDIMVMEFQLLCPHTEVEAIPAPVPVNNSGLSSPPNPVEYRCTYCGYVHGRV
jgi:hypothetical protein